MLTTLPSVTLLHLGKANKFALRSTSATPASNTSPTSGTVQMSLIHLRAAAMSSLLAEATSTMPCRGVGSADNSPSSSILMMVLFAAFDSIQRCSWPLAGLGLNLLDDLATLVHSI